MQAHSRFGAPLKQSHFSFVRLCLRIFNSPGRLCMYFTYRRCKFGHYNESCAREKATRCSKVVKDFMTKNCLKLISNETQFLPVTKYFAYTDFEPPVLDDKTVTCISPSAGIQNFSVTIDCSLPFHSPSITILSTAKNKINSELSASQHTRNTLLSPVGLISAALSTMVYLTIILLLSNQSKTLVPKQSLMLEGLIPPRSSCLSCIGSLSICVRSTTLF